MAKKYTKKQLEGKILHVLIVSLEVIRQSAKELHKLNIPKEDWKAKDSSDDVKRGRALITQMNTFNYAIQPLFGLAHQLLPQAKQLVDACEFNYNQALKDGVFEECICVGCDEGRNKS